MNLDLSAPVAACILVGAMLASIGASYGMFALGRKLGLTFGGHRRTWLYFGVVAVVFFGIGIAAGFVPQMWLDRVTVAMFVIVCTALPISLGFAGGVVTFQRENERRIAERTDAWLSEWDREHSDWSGR